MLSEQPSALGRLRRFGRMIVGDQRDADDLIRSFLETSEKRAFEGLLRPASNEAMATGFSLVAKIFRRGPYFVSGGAVGQSRLQEMAQNDLDLLTPDERLIFALSEVERYEIHEVASILSMPDAHVEAIAESTVRRVFAQPRIALYIEPDATIRDFISAYLVERQIESASFHRSDEALKVAESYDFDLLVAEPVADDGGDSAEMLAMYAEHLFVPVVWTTGSPWRITPREELEATVLAKPFEPDDLVNEARAALHIRPHRWVPPDATFRWPTTDAAEIPDEALAPLLAPIDAEVLDGQLRIAPVDAPDAVVPFSALDAVRRQHREQALDLASDVRSGNGSPRILRKLDALAAMLGEALTEDVVVGLAVGVDGYARLLPTIQEEFLPLAAADMASFVHDLQAFTNQFPVCRQFRAEAEAARPIPPDEEAALTSVVAVLIEQPDEVVAPAVKQRFETLRSARAIQAGSAVSDVAWLRSVSNSLKAVARYAKAVGRDVHADVRGKVVKGVSALIVALPVAVGLKLLGASYPVEFAALTLLLKQSKERIEETLGEDSEEVN